MGEGIIDAEKLKISGSSNKNEFFIDVKKRVPCQIPELGLSCWGCCGNGFENKQDVEDDIVESTIEFEKICKNPKKPSKKDLKKFRDRYDGDTIAPSGLCFNLIQFDDGCLACPLHNLVNEVVSKEVYVGPKEDLREFPCDVNYECVTFKKWFLMSEKQKQEYFIWLAEKHGKNEISHYDYSLGNHDGVFIEEFLEEKNIILKN